MARYSRKRRGGAGRRMKRGRVRSMRRGRSYSRRSVSPKRRIAKRRNRLVGDRM